MDIAGEQAQVLVVRDGRARRVPVRLGLRGLTLTEVVEGLNQGEVVLAQGEKPVSDGQRVRAIEQPLPVSATQSNQAASQPL